MLRTKFKYEKQQRAITQKLSKQELDDSCALHSPWMRSIHPWNFITLARVVLEICSGQRTGHHPPARQGWSHTTSRLWRAYNDKFTLHHCFWKCHIFLSCPFTNSQKIYKTKGNPFPHNKILDQTKLKVFAMTNVTKMIIFVTDSLENIMGKGEIACISNFSFSNYVLESLLSQTLQRCHCVWMG